MIVIDQQLLVFLFVLAAIYFWANDPGRAVRRQEKWDRLMGKLPPEPPTRMQRLGYWVAEQMEGK